MNVHVCVVENADVVEYNRSTTLKIRSVEI